VFRTICFFLLYSILQWTREQGRINKRTKARVSDCCLTPTLYFHLYHERNKLHFNVIMLPVLYQHNTPGWYFSSLLPST
jgi:hypothetical protein